MPDRENIQEHIIGQLNESSLHNQIKYLLADETDEVEKKLGKYYIDIVKPDRLVEIQTGNFSSIRNKLENLVKDHKVDLVYPVAWQKVIVYLDPESKKELSRRKSPKKGRMLDIFDELIRIPMIYSNPNFRLQVALIKIEEIRLRDGKGSWRRGGVSIINRRLTELVDLVQFDDNQDLLNLLPNIKGQTFTTKSLAQKCNIRIGMSRKICYALKNTGAIEQVGKEGNAYIYKTI